MILALTTGDSVTANAPVNSHALSGDPLIVPKDARTQDIAVCIQKRQTVHLPGQPNRGNMGGVDAGRGEYLAYALNRPIPKECSVLFTPLRLRGLKRIFGCRNGD